MLLCQLCSAGVFAIFLGTGLTASASAHAHGRHSISLETHGKEPIESCTDLHARSEYGEVAVKEESRTITRTEASRLTVKAEDNGAMQVQGWDKNEYSATLCKAALAGAEGERILSQIKLNFQNGELSVSGPLHSDEDWATYLLIRAPRSAALDLHVNNGPLNLYQVDGSIKGKGVNGPVALEDCTGEIELSVENGPVSLHGGSGRIDLRTQNGPVTVSLKGQSWSGTGLEAHAVNGPVTFNIPQDYESSVVVESQGNGPLSCRAKACAEGRKTWDEERKRVEFGSGPAVIRVSTVNGPLSVR